MVVHSELARGGGGVCSRYCAGTSVSKATGGRCYSVFVIQGNQFIVLRLFPCLALRILTAHTFLGH